MKKEIIDSITGVFTDYKGLQHHITVVATSQSAKEVDEYGTCYEVSTYIEDEGTDYYCGLAKTLRIGISICNPEDTYNEKVGYNKALARARASQPVMFVTKAGIINTKMVKALLEQELEFAINNPDTIIPGYSKTMQTYLRNKENEKLLSSLSNEEQIALAYRTQAPEETVVKIERLAKYLKNKQ